MPTTSTPTRHPHPTPPTPILTPLPPPQQMFPEYADYIYAIGLLDLKQRNYFSSRIANITSLMRKGRNVDAIKVSHNLRFIIGQS